MKIESSNFTFQCIKALAHAASKRNEDVFFYIFPFDQEYHAELGILDVDALNESKRMVIDTIETEGI